MADILGSGDLRDCAAINSQSQLLVFYHVVPVLQ